MTKTMQNRAPEQDDAAPGSAGIMLPKQNVGPSDESVAVPRGKSRSERRINELITEFQSDAVEIEEGPPPRVALATTYLLLALFATGIAYASIAEVDRIVTASGKLTTTAHQIVVQPFETAAIRGINVRVGDVVRKGDLLATLDSTFVAADLAQLETQRSSFRAEMDRLQAELDGTPYDVGADANPDQLQQKAIFEHRRATFAARVSAADQEIAEVLANIRTLDRDIEVLQQRYSVVEEVEKMRKELEKTAVGSKLNVLIAQNDRLAITRELDRTRNTRVEEQHKLATLQARREALIQDWRQQAASQLVEVQRRHDSVVDQLQKAQRRKELIQLTAPEDAVVLQMAQRSVGSIVEGAEQLFTLVPLNSELEADVQISPEDVGLLTTGLPVKIKLDAFPFQKHGMMLGDLRTISENTMPSENRQDPRVYYRGRVTLTETQLRNFPETARLIPGMTLSAEIKLGTRSVLSYFLYPLIRTFDESLREP